MGYNEILKYHYIMDIYNLTENYYTVFQLCNFSRGIFVFVCCNPTRASWYKLVSQRIILCYAFVTVVLIKAQKFPVSTVGISLTMANITLQKKTWDAMTPIRRSKLLQHQSFC